MVLRLLGVVGCRDGRMGVYPERVVGVLQKLRASVQGLGLT